MNNLLKNKKEFMMMGLAALFGLAAFLLIQQYIEPVPTIVANQNIKSGTVLQKSMLSTDRIAKAWRYEKAISPDHMHRIIGYPISVTLQPGDPVLWSHFVAKQRVKGMADLIEKGKRAVSVAFDTISSVSGNINANDHIDILFTYKDPKTGGKITTTLFQNKKVLSTGIRNQSTHGSLTLLLEPKESEILIFAKHRGYMVASLRNPDDTDIIKITPVDFNDIITLLGSIPVVNDHNIELDQRVQSVENIMKKNSSRKRN